MGNTCIQCAGCVCSSSCFPFTGKTPPPPLQLLPLPEDKGQGQTFLVKEFLDIHPWDQSCDVQWLVKNAEGKDWFFITTNSDWEHFESVKGLWAIVKEYPRPPASKGGGTTGSTTGSTTNNPILSIYLHLQQSRGLVHATFRKNDVDVATASWFVTASAIECMGTQVAIDTMSDGAAGLDWQLRRSDATTLLLNHVNQPAAIIQLHVTVPSVLGEEGEESNEGEAEQGEQEEPTKNQAGAERHEGKKNSRKDSNQEVHRAQCFQPLVKPTAVTQSCTTTPTTTVSNKSTSNNRATKPTKTSTTSPPPSSLSRSSSASVQDRYAPTHPPPCPPKAFCVHTAETEDAMLMLAMGFFFGSGVIRAIRQRWEDELEEELGVGPAAARRSGGAVPVS